jgi:hypothetical protein
VIFLHLPIGENVLSPRRSITTYYKIASLIIHYLGAFTVGEATASVHRTELAVVGHKCTNSHVTRKRGSTKLGQLTREERCTRVPVSIIQSDQQGLKLLATMTT